MYCTKCGEQVNEENGKCPKCEPDIKHTNNKQRVRIGLCILAIAVILIWCMDGIIARSMPWLYVNKGLKNTMKRLDEEVEKQFKALPYAKGEQGKYFEQELILGVNGVTGADQFMEEGLKNSKIEIMRQKSNAQNLYTIGAKVDGEKVELELFYDQKQLGLRIKGITKEFLMIDLENFAERFNDSELREWIDIEELPEDLNMEELDQLALTEETQKLIKEELKVIKKASKLKYDGKKPLESQKLRMFNLEIPQDVLCEQLAALFEIITDDEHFIEYMGLKQSRYYSKSDMKEMLRRSQKEFSEMMEEVAGDENVIVTLGVNSNKRLVYGTSEMVFDNDGDEVCLEFEMKLLGKKLITDLIEVEMSVADAYDEMHMALNFESNLGEKGKEIKQQLEVAMAYDKENLFKGELTSCYTPKAKSDQYEIQGEITIEDEVSFYLEGEATIKQENKSYALVFEELEVGAKSLYYDERYNISGYLEYKYTPTKQQELLPSKTIDLLEMDEEALYELQEAFWKY